LVPIQELLVARIRPILFILLATVGLVLLTACANLANLTLARLIRREREIVVRVALGAERGRLIRQLLTESILFSLLGGALGLALTAAGAKGLISFARLFTTRVQSIDIDANVLIFTLVVSALTGIGFGLLPALQVTRYNLSGFLKERGASAMGATRQRFRSALVIVQVALAFVLLDGAGLMVRSLLELQRVDGGYDPANVLSVRVPLPFNKYSGEKAPQFFQRLLEEVRRHPAVRSAAIANSFPLYKAGDSRAIRIEGRPFAPEEEAPQADFRMVSPGYFKTLSIPLVKGRELAESDVDGALPVAVVSRSLARQSWPGQSPIGRRIASPSIGDGVWLTVVGVVEDVRQAGLTAEPNATFYLSYLQTEAMEMSLLVRTAGNPSSLTNEIRRAVHALDPEQPIADVQTLAELRSRSIAPSRLTAGLLVVFAVLAFTITAVGLSAVVGFVVGQRTPEIGLRMALGAEPMEVLGLILRQGMLPVTIGLALGVFASFSGARLLASQLYGVVPGDLITFLCVLCLLLVVALVACLIPARRATAIDPLIALRSS
jgi:putative ABC transport system permease protein